MARKRELSWHKARGCYRKVYRGTTHYLKSECRNKSDEEGYRAALREWQAVKAYADHEGPEPYEGGKWDPGIYTKKLARWLILEDERQPAPTPAKPQNVAAMATNYAKHSFTPGVIARIESKDVTLESLFAEYLRQRRAKAEAGKLSVSQYAHDKAKLEDFEGFAKHHEKTLLSQIDGPFLSFYKECQEVLTAHSKKSERISSETARKRLQTIHKVWNWAYQQEYLDRLPRVLSKGYAQIEVKRPKPQFWTAEEVKTLFNASSNRTKLYILLASNCAYTQSEISSLTWEMIDTDGVIRRQRPKTEQNQVHNLWPMTLDLLREEAKSTEGLCLISQKGNPLLSQEIKEDGSITHQDSIRLAFNRVLTKLKLTKCGKTFKHIRKTSAQAILQQFEDERLVDMFLGHSTKGAVREHYTEPVYKRYFEAIEWLESYYSFSLTPEEEPKEE